jgi:PIN domain nuclease of toxin-antitoxin system
MDLLLDTHALLWFLNGDDSLSNKARLAILNIENSKFISIASIWEISIKKSLDKLRFPSGLKRMLELIEENGFQLLPVTTEYALVLSTLEFKHRDPFDRLLVAQCLTDNLFLISKDVMIKNYDVQLFW